MMSLLEGSKPQYLHIEINDVGRWVARLRKG
jgi:hypothetical protein